MENPDINNKNIEDILALSPIQTGILYESLIRKDSTFYVAQLSLGLRGKIQADMLQRSCDMVCEKNEMLRSMFRWEKLQNPVQIIIKKYALPFHVEALDNMSLSDARVKVTELKMAAKKTAIDIKTRPVDIRLFKYGEKHYEFVVTWHHIVYDGWSSMLFIGEVFQTYERLLKGESIKFIPKIQYKEYIRLSRKGSDSERERRFWKEYFKDYQASGRESENHILINETAAIAEHRFKMKKGHMQKVSAYLARKQLTAADLIYAVWGILIYKYTGMCDFVIGATFSGRNIGIAGMEGTIGLFINTLPLRIEVARGMKIKDVIHDIAARKRKLFAHEAGNLGDIKKFAGIRSGDNLFHSLVVMENYPVMLEKWQNKAANTFYIESYSLDEKSHYELVMGVLPPNHDTFLIQYSKELYTEEYVFCMAEDFRELLVLIVTGGSEETPVDEVKLSTFADGQKQSYQHGISKEIPKEAGHGYIAHDIEAELLAIWQKVLSAQDIGAETNFFDIGGNSVLFLRMASEIEKRYPEVLNLAEAFSHPSIRALGKLIYEKRENEKTQQGKTEKGKVVSSEKNIEGPEVYSRLNKDYFLAADADSSRYSTLVADMEAGLHTDIKRAADALGISEPSIILGAFLKSVSRAGESGQAVVHFIKNADEEVVLLEQKECAGEEVAEYLRTVDQCYQSATVRFGLTDVKESGHTRPPQSAKLLFYDMDYYQFKQSLLFSYDIVLGASFTEEEISFIYRFNNQYLNKDRAEDLFYRLMDELVAFASELKPMFEITDELYFNRD